MKKVHEAVARSLAAHRSDYPEARFAFDSMARDLAEVLSVSDDDWPAFMTASGNEVVPEPRADRAIPDDVRGLLTAAEAALAGGSPGAAHDALLGIAGYLKDLFALQAACARCGTPYEWGDGDRPGLCRACAGNDDSRGTPKTRYRYAKAVVPDGKSAADYAEAIKKYLPRARNYRVASIVLGDPVWVLIAGEDKAGWTLNQYVIPRLWSGLIRADEIAEGDTRPV